MRWRSKPKYRVWPTNFPGGFVPRPPHFNAFSTHLIYRGHAVGCGTPQNCGPFVKVATLGFLCQSASELHQYCSNLHLKVNLRKNNVVISNKTGRLRTDIFFSLEGD